MDDIVNRLNIIKKYYKLSGNGLAKIIDMSVTSVNCFFAGKSKVSGEFLCKLLDAYPSISAEWLMRGNGNMLIEDKPTTDEKLMKELADMKVKLLVQTGVTDRICKILEDRIDHNKDEVITQKWEGKLG